MKKMSKTLSVIMAILMVIAAIPMTAFAADYTISLGETITVTAPVEGYAECKFTPEADGKYIVYSDMGEADIDPYVDVYDADGNEISSDDDNDYADTYDFYCIFEVEAGADYLFKLAAWDYYAVEFDITVVKFAEITHQPTADEPYVEVTEDADAEYQWYRVTGNTVEVTDENATAREGDTEGEYATYDSANGWTGVYTGYEDGIYKEYNFFKVMLPEDQTIKMTADTDAVELGIWCICGDSDEDWEDVNANDTVEYTADHTCVYNTWGMYAQVPHLKAEMPEMKKVNTDAELESDEVGTYVCLVTFDGCRYEVSDVIYRAAPPEAIKLNETKTVTAPKDAYKELTFTPEKDGKYVVYSDNGGNDDEIDPFVYIYDSLGNQIAYDDDNDYTWGYNFCCEFEAEAGEVYYLQFCAYDDTVTYDVTVVNRAEISHQPTEAEPYVEIAPEANASYQWFKAREGEAEITDKNVVNIVELDTVSTYSASKGWTPANEPAYYDADKDFYQFFKIYLEEGDKLTLDINGTVEEYIAIESDEDYIEFELTTSETNGSYTFEVEYTGVYTVYCYGEPGLTAKATVNGTYLEKIDGATDAALTPDEKCEYICIATYDAGRYELSDKVEITDLTPYCTCRCHQTGFMAFLFKIVLFFQKIFGQNKVCWCGVAH